jgi:hypothetical protein
LSLWNSVCGSPCIATVTRFGPVVRVDCTPGPAVVAAGGAGAQALSKSVSVRHNARALVQYPIGCLMICLSLPAAARYPEAVYFQDQLSAFHSAVSRSAPGGPARLPAWATTSKP